MLLHLLVLLCTTVTILVTGSEVSKAGAKKTHKGARRSTKTKRKGVRGTKKGVKEPRRRSHKTCKKSQTEESTVDLTWKDRQKTEIDDCCGRTPIPEPQLPPIDITFVRPQLARKSRLLNARLRRDWRYLVEEESNPNFQSGRYGATFSMPTGWPPKGPDPADK